MSSEKTSNHLLISLIMIKLKSIKITGFKEKDRVVNLKFSDEPATVIYGENGSGKTTLLRVIHAIFTKNSNYLHEQNVREIELTYFKEVEKTLYIKSEKDDFTGDIQYQWGENFEGLVESNSILFGVNRGIISDNTDVDFEEVLQVLNSQQRKFLRSRDFRLEKFRNYAHRIIGNSTQTWTDSHIFVDSISINNIKKIIISEHKKGLKIRYEKVQNAFFNTISNAVDIEMRQKDYALPLNFEERIESKKNVLISLIEGLDQSSLQQKVLNYLQNKETNSEIQDSKIFRALLLNILEKAEEENIELKAVNTLIHVFNSHLYRNKKLIVAEGEAYIQFVNGQLGPRHSLDKLSSGERHLLTFLTLFLIIGRGRDFFIIDEPEISMNMKWQRKLLSLLNELSPNSQIIVATHSPDIASRNSNYLVELV